MITVLLAPHPGARRARCGDDLRALLEVQPLTVRSVLDVVLNAGRQQASGQDPPAGPGGGVDDVRGHGALVTCVQDA